MLNTWIMATCVIIFVFFTVFKIYFFTMFSRKLSTPIDEHIAHWNHNLKQNANVYSIEITRLIYAYNKLSIDERNSCELFLDCNSVESDFPQKILDNFTKTLFAIMTSILATVLIMSNRLPTTESNIVLNINSTIMSSWESILIIATFLLSTWIIDYGFDRIKMNKINFHHKVLKHIKENPTNTPPSAAPSPSQSAS